MIGVVILSFSSLIFSMCEFRVNSTTGNIEYLFLIIL